MGELPTESIRNEVQFSRILSQNTDFGNLSLIEWRVVTYMLSQINENTDSDDFVYFDIANFCRLYHISDRYVVECAIIKLVKHSFEIAKNEKVFKVALFGPLDKNEWFYYNKDEIVGAKQKCVSITFNKKIIPFVKRRSKRYALFKFGYTVKFRSKYTYPIYYWICSYRGFEGKIVRITRDSALRQFASGKYAKNFRHFEQYVLIPALDEINKYTDLTVEYKEYLNRKNKVIGLQFRFTIKPYELRKKLLDDLKSQTSLDNDSFWNDDLF